MNAQEIFDTVVTHLRKQGSKSQEYYTNGVDQCVYRNSDGKKCAIGCLISDEEYFDDMEGQPVINLFGQGYLSHLRPYEDLLSRLQAIHDENMVSQWEGAFAEVADNFDLIMPGQP